MTETKSKTAKPAATPKAPSAAKPAVGAKAGGTGTAVKKKPGMPTIAVFIDVDNTNASRDNLLEIFTNLNLRGTVVSGKLYGYDTDSGFDDLVKQYKLQTVGKAAKDGSASVVDARLVVDAMVAAGSKKQEYIFVWAGVGDLSALFQQIKQLKGKTFTLDVPGHASENQFVDQKMRLFSPIARGTPVPTVAPAARPSSTVVASTAHVSPAAMPEPNVPVEEPEPVMSTKDALAEIEQFDWDSMEDGGAALNFDDSELDGLDDLNDIYDDDEEYEDGLEDFSDIDVDANDVYAGGVGDDYDPSVGPMTMSENERLLAITEQMLVDMKQKGKTVNLDARKIAKEIKLDDETLGIPEMTEAERNAMYPKKSSYAVFEYGMEDSGAAPDDKIPLEGPDKDEFNDFGKV